MKECASGRIIKDVTRATTANTIGMGTRKKIKEQEKEDVSKKITQICNVVEKQQHMFATSYQEMKKELLQEISKNVECGVPSEIKSVPPGLSKGSEPLPERTEEKGPKVNQYLKENDSQATEKVKPEEANNHYQYPWSKWTEWLYSEPESYGSFGWNEQPKHNWSGKGQGSKGEFQLKTDPGAGVDI